MSKKFFEKMRFKIAVILDKRKDTCWADLAMWAINITGDYKLRDYIPPKIGGTKWYTGVSICRQEARQCGSCYCGKFVNEENSHPRGIVVTSEVTEEDSPDIVFVTFKEN